MKDTGHFTHPMRRLPLISAQNTRDLGGYPCEGGNTRWGVFVRSDSTHGLGRADLQMLCDYGICNALDLRGGEERDILPSRLEEDSRFTTHHVSLSDQLSTADYEGDVPGSMSGLYISLLDNATQSLCEIMRFLATTEGGTLFHCAVGKDRTGVVAMLLLSLAGVPEQDIVADYAVSEIYMQGVFDHTFRKKEQRREIAPYRISSLPKSMWRTLTHLHDNYGTAADYLAYTGLEPEEIQLIRAKFVEKT